MTTDTSRPAHRPPFVRLEGYDYSRPGGYAVTLCVTNRECLFGNIVDGKFVPHEFGRIVQEEWERSSELRREIRLDVFTVMPNHFHGIVFIEDAEEDTHCRARLHAIQDHAPVVHHRPKSLGTFIAGFKAYSTKRINLLRQAPGLRVWQPDYHDHIIRDEQDLARHREYIVNNPLQWSLDEENPVNREFPPSLADH